MLNHVLTAARMLNVLQLLVLDLCKLFAKSLLILLTLHSFATVRYFAARMQITPSNCISVKRYNRVFA